ncbi:MAG: DUF2341 domain-containing protein [Verrucomicrobiota bacterium]
MFPVPPRLRPRARRAAFSALLLMLAGTALSWAEGPANWWKPEWTARKKITLNTGAEGVALASPPGSPVVLVRLSSDFAFGTAKEDGSDLRFVSGDHKTVLPFHIERWDSLLNEAFVWVKVPDPKAGATDLWLYYGNPAAERASDPKATYDTDTLSVYHFSENGGAPADSSPHAVNAEGIGVPVATALIGGGVRFTGQNALTIPANPALAWTAGGALTVSVWVKPATPGPNAVILSRRENGQSFLLGLDSGVPYISVTGANGELRSPASPDIGTGTWHHLAVTALNGTFSLYVDGEPRVVLTSALPGLAGPISIGRDEPIGNNVAGFAGELDELEISKIALSPGAIKLAAVNQGSSPDAAKLLVTAAEETAGGAAEHSEIAEHLNLIKGISKSLTFDGWVVIWLCVILAVIGWGVAIGKLLYLNKISRASKVFIKQWKTISTDITALDHADEANVRSMGGGTSNQDQKAMRESPLFHLYHLGSQEIQHRITNARGNFTGLPERSITSIRALLDGGATRETQKLQSKLVFLTIGIAGGPYLGLLGTVIGVMITFAVIAKSGEVDINSIAPGIAGALLATVAGLAVAIPALFAYSYLASRIKDAILGMNTFIEEFIARIAEAYPSND